MNTIEERLSSLTEAGKKIQQSVPVDFRDLHSLSEDRRIAWASFLCSIATTESIEKMMIEPIQEAFSESDSCDVISEYLTMHGEDERRHYQMLTDYVQKTFQYEKKRRSGSDVVVYGFLLPQFARLGSLKPLYLLTPLRFYEAFSLEFYKSLKKLAATDGLNSLVQLIQTIEKDEFRHLAGLEILMREHRDKSGDPSAADLLVIRSMMQVLLFDIEISPWAIHNRRVRRNAMAIGIDPVQMGRDARGAAEDAIQFAKGTKKGKKK